MAVFAFENNERHFALTYFSTVSRPRLLIYCLLLETCIFHLSLSLKEIKKSLSEQN